MEKQSYLIAKTAEQVEEAILEDKLMKAIERIEELKHYLKEVDGTSTYEQELDGLLKTLEINDTLNSLEEKKKSALGTLNTIKYRFAGDLFDSPSSVDYLGLNDLDINLEYLIEESILINKESIDDSRPITEEQYRQQILKETLVDRLGIHISIAEIPPSFQKIIVFLIAEQREFALQQANKSMEQAKRAEKMTDVFEDATQDLKELNSEVSETLEESGVSELTDLKDKLNKD